MYATCVSLMSGYSLCFGFNFVSPCLPFFDVTKKNRQRALHMHSPQRRSLTASSQRPAPPSALLFLYRASKEFQHHTKDLPFQRGEANVDLLRNNKFMFPRTQILSACVNAKLSLKMKCNRGGVL